MSQKIQLTGLSRKISIDKRDIKNVFISTYPPTKCGIANYTKDLTSAINLLNPTQLSRIVAVNSFVETLEYPWEVDCQINPEDDDNYKMAADFINGEKFQVACLQHEFGIYGGDYGEKVLALAKNLKVPLVITFHTVLKTPSDKEKMITQKLGKIAKVIVVMGQIPKKRLANIYGIDPRKVVIIPVGIPDLPFDPTEIYKELLGINGNFLIGTFGLIGPNKGYEYLIKALPAVFEKHPRTVAVIVGETHPRVKTWEGEVYREKLVKLTEKLGIQSRVHFLNKYFPTAELTSIVQAMDIFVAPYIASQQISSAALSFALGSGRACIATPFPHAKELLAENRGIIVPFKNPYKITDAINFLIENPENRQAMAQSSYLFGRRMTWVKVAETYLDVFRFIKNVYHR